MLLCLPNNGVPLALALNRVGERLPPFRSPLPGVELRSPMLGLPREFTGDPLVLSLK